MSGPRIVIMAGGTGGHIFPALAVADCLRDQGASVSWLGSRHGMEARLVPQYGYDLDCIDVAGLRGKGVVKLLMAPLQIGRALLQALRILRRRRPQAVLGLGGFASGPGGVAACLLRIPLAVHEQNAIAGMTNRWLSRIADRVMEAFPGSFPASVAVTETGNPVRESIASLPDPAVRWRQRDGKLHLLVLGGSLGAQALNAVLPDTLAPHAERITVKHQVGRGDVSQVAQAYVQVGVDADVVAFIDDMDAAYGWADVAVCRAGALTISELAAAGLPAVLVPFPHAVDDHQTRNAAYFTADGAGWLLPQTDLEARLPELLSEIAQGREALLDRARKARSLARPQAARQVAQVCLELAGAEL